MSDWLPMSGFDPSRPALVHDRLNDRTIDWQPERYLEHFRRYAHLDFDPEKGLAEWDGLLLDGWRPSPSAAISPP